MLIMVIVWQFVCILRIFLDLFPEFNLWSTHIKNKLLKFGHCPEGGGGFWACSNCLEHFFY